MKNMFILEGVNLIEPYKNVIKSFLSKLAQLKSYFLLNIAQIQHKGDKII